MNMTGAEIEPKQANERICACCGERDEPASEKESFYETHKIGFLLVSGTLLGLAIAWDLFKGEIWLGQLFASLSALLSGPNIFKGAVRELRHKTININFLMTTAMVGSFIILHGQEGAAALFLFSLAELIEDHTIERSKRAIHKLVELTPEEVLIKHDATCTIGEETSGEHLPTHPVPAQQVKIGQVIVILPGKRVPLDGTVTCGESYVDQSAITGESKPASKSAGEKVYAGTVNGDGYLEVEVGSSSENTLLARITREIEDALKNKSQAERFVEKFARYYTPLIAVAALLTAMIPVLAFSQEFYPWFYRALVLLVVACPCALSLSTPITIISSLTRLSTRGILVKGGKYIEEIQRVKVLALDKTGTLTEGKLSVHDVVDFTGRGEAEILRLAGSLEGKSEHPIGQAIIRAAHDRHLEFAGVESFKIQKGEGIQGVINSQQYYLGSVEFATKYGASVPPEVVSKFRGEGKTVNVLVEGQSIAGILTVRDTIRMSAPILIHALQNRGIIPIILSGDNAQTVEVMARQLGISEYYGGLLPDQKIMKIQDFRRRYTHVAMIGDGINDAPALAAANVGIAMGRSGSDITIENADITLMDDDLTKFIALLNIASQTRRKLRQNIWGSILVKISFAILAVAGLISLWVAVGIGDMGVSLAVAFNGLSILAFKDLSLTIEKSLKGETPRTAVCEMCGKSFSIPSHCGLQMVKEGTKLVCWRELDAKIVNGKNPKMEYLQKEPLCPECEENA